MQLIARLTGAKLSGTVPLVIASLLYAACATASAAEVKLGLAATLTGPVAKYGLAIRNGMTLATGEINARGGVNGNTLTLVVDDEQAKKEEAINVYKRLIYQDKVLMIFGPTLSTLAFAADPIANAAKVVVIGTSTTADGVTAMGPFVLRNAIMEADVLPVTTRAAVKHFGLKKVAIIYGNDDAVTKSDYDIFKTTLPKQNIAITTTETYSQGDVDFKGAVDEDQGHQPRRDRLCLHRRRSRQHHFAGPSAGHETTIHRRQRPELAEIVRHRQVRGGRHYRRRPLVVGKSRVREPGLHRRLQGEIQ